MLGLEGAFSSSTVQDVGKATTCHVQYLKDDAPFPVLVGLCEELGSAALSTCGPTAVTSRTLWTLC